MAWTIADQNEALSMGWLIADIDGTGKLEIQRHDANPCGFVSDVDALEWVRLAAALGNDMEKRALETVGLSQ